MRCRRSSVARDAASDAVLGSSFGTVLPRGDRVEQFLGGEVEPRQFLGGEHADREARRGDGALHEHAVEFDLHHAAEPANDEHTENRWQGGKRNG